ncbi:nucleoside triphosphate pyrophosphatase YhdE [Gammaproteobacteria bacterium]
MLLLASQSLRRRELLDQIGVPHETLAVGVDESPLPGETPSDCAVRLALAKARRGHGISGGQRPVLGADTLVWAGEILGKPRDRAEGLAMLAVLSDRSHEVVTAVALVWPGQEATRLCVSRVRFRAMSPREMAAYWETGEPWDKAGAYAIQGRGALFVASLEGSYSGVMGLPLFETGELLAEACLLPPLHPASRELCHQ